MYELINRYERLATKCPALAHPCEFAVAGVFKSPVHASELEIQNHLLNQLPDGMIIVKHGGKFSITQCYDTENPYRWGSCMYLENYTTKPESFPTLLETLLDYFERR